jgi:hypothetical protein
MDAQIYKAVRRWGELTQLDTAFSKYPSCLVVYKIALVVDYLANTDLCYLDTACQARAGGETDTSLGGIVAAGTCVLSVVCFLARNM